MEKFDKKMWEVFDKERQKVVASIKTPIKGCAARKWGFLQWIKYGGIMKIRHCFECPLDGKEKKCETYRLEVQAEIYYVDFLIA